MSEPILANSIICADVLEGLHRIPDASVHLVVSSPPYNVKISYANCSDDLPHDEYLSWMEKVWRECYRVLVRGGRMCINIDATTNVDDRDEYPELVHPLHVDFINQFREIGYIYRGEHIWEKQNCCGSKTAWGSYQSCSNPRIRRTHEYIIVVSKEDTKLEGDKSLCDLTKDDFHDWTLSTWKFNPATAVRFHPAPFPHDLPKRCIKLYSYIGNTVLDVFNGTGTTTTVAIHLKRNYIGIDHCQDYCDIALKSAKLAKSEFK